MEFRDDFTVLVIAGPVPEDGVSRIRIPVPLSVPGVSLRLWTAFRCGICMRRDACPGPAFLAMRIARVPCFLMNSEPGF